MQMFGQLNQNIRNPKLFDLLKNLTKTFIDALDKPFSPDYGSWYDRIKALIDGDPELFAKILEKRPDLEEKKLSYCLVSAKRCLQTFLKEDICRNAPHASTLEAYQNELAFFLEKLFKERERIRVRGLFSSPEAFARHFDGIFLREYLKYEKYLFDDSVSDLLICPLPDFICSKNIELGNHLAIRKITQEEFHSLVEADERHGYQLESYPDFILCVRVDSGNWQDDIDRVITSLRLLKRERMGLLRIYYSYAFPCRPWKIVETPLGTKSKSAEAFFHLADSEYEELKNLFMLLNRVKDAGYLAISIRRFNFAYERERLEDSWIDYFVSLESLYSKASELTEVTHRLATRVALALGTDSLAGKKEIRDKIKKWYRVRSKVIHGLKVNLSQKQFQELEEILRRSIRWFINQKEYANHDKIIDLLDLSSMNSS